MTVRLARSVFPGVFALGAGIAGCGDADGDVLFGARPGASGSGVPSSSTTGAGGGGTTSSTSSSSGGAETTSTGTTSTGTTSTSMTTTTTASGAGGAGGSGACGSCAALDGPCVVGSCVQGACVATPRPDGTACDDANACTTGDACMGGACAAGAPVACPNPSACAVATCDPGSGACVPKNVADGTACDDGDPATTNDACAAGACVGTKAALGFLPRLVEVATDQPDYLVIQNVGDAAGSLVGLHLLLISSSNVPLGYSPGFDMVLPNVVLAPQQKVYVVEPSGGPKATELAMPKDIWWWWGGGGALLCTDVCTAQTVLDVFWMGTLKSAPPPSVTFDPPIPGNPNGQAPMPTWLRGGFTAKPPAFFTLDWAMGQPTR